MSESVSAQGGTSQPSSQSVLPAYNANDVQIKNSIIEMLDNVGASATPEQNEDVGEDADFAEDGQGYQEDQIDEGQDQDQQAEDESVDGDDQDQGAVEDKAEQSPRYQQRINDLVKQRDEAREASLRNEYTVKMHAEAVQILNQKYNEVLAQLAEYEGMSPAEIRLAQIELRDEINGLTGKYQEALEKTRRDTVVAERKSALKDSIIQAAKAFEQQGVQPRDVYMEMMADPRLTPDQAARQVLARWQRSAGRTKQNVKAQNLPRTSTNAVPQRPQQTIKGQAATTGRVTLNDVKNDIQTELSRAFDKPPPQKNSPPQKGGNRKK